jgi:hypothetical protein
MKVKGLPMQSKTQINVDHWQIWCNTATICRLTFATALFLWCGEWFRWLQKFPENFPKMNGFRACGQFFLDITRTSPFTLTNDNQEHSLCAVGFVKHKQPIELLGARYCSAHVTFQSAPGPNQGQAG